MRNDSYSWNHLRIQVLCTTNRIPDVMQISNVWLIPKTASKPKDGSFKKSPGYIHRHFDELRYYSQPLHTHAQKQPAKPSADATHLDFLLMWVK